MSHGHMCGNVARRDGDPWRWDESAGCGCIWFHNDKAFTDKRVPAGVRLQMCKNMHQCPRCGKEAWTKLPEPIGMQLTELTR